MKSPILSLMMLAMGLSSGAYIYHIGKWVYFGMVFGLIVLVVLILVSDWYVGLPNKQKRGGTGIFYEEGDG